MTEKFRLTNTKLLGTLMKPGAVFTMEQGPVSIIKTIWMREVPCAEAIESILWLAIISQPDISYIIGVLAQFIQNPGTLH